jgi:hypothetical protein
MAPTLGQICRDANVISKTQWNTLQCDFIEPRGGKLGSFFTFRESEKT